MRTRPISQAPPPVLGWIPHVLLILWMVLGTPQAGHAVNGLNLIGSGGWSSGLAGADTAIALDFTAMNTNPAGMSRINEWTAGLSFGMLKPNTQFQNVANNVQGSDDALLFTNVGYIKTLSGTPISLGIGFFTTGGIATDFRGLRTPFALDDRTSSQLRHYKLAPTISIQLTDSLSIGASLGLSYADAALTVLPNTPTGFAIEGSCTHHSGLAPPGGTCAYALGLTPKFGIMYQVTDRMTLGMAYTMGTNLPLRGGRGTQNLGPLGTATFDVNASGLKWADDLAVGLSYRPTDALLLAFKFQWINWDGALNNVVVDFTNGSNPLVPTSRVVVPFDWRDQYVTAVGAAYDLTQAVNLHGGYNFGNNPTRSTSLDPTTANITQHHLVGGLLYRITPSLWFDSNFTYVLTATETYNSAIYGPNTTSRVGGYELIFTLGYWPKS
jgi:long-chain fatty acid transport protein